MMPAIGGPTIRGSDATLCRQTQSGSLLSRQRDPGDIACDARGHETAADCHVGERCQHPHELVPRKERGPGETDAAEGGNYRAEAHRPWLTHPPIDAFLARYRAA